MNSKESINFLYIVNFCTCYPTNISYDFLMIYYRLICFVRLTLRLKFRLLFLKCLKVCWLWKFMIGHPNCTFLIKSKIAFSKKRCHFFPLFILRYKVLKWLLRHPLTFIEFLIVFMCCFNLWSLGDRKGSVQDMTF